MCIFSNGYHGAVNLESEEGIQIWPIQRKLSGKHLGFYCIMSFSCIESLLYEMLRFLICKEMVQQ